MDVTLAHSDWLCTAAHSDFSMTVTALSKCIQFPAICQNSSRNKLKNIVQQTNITNYGEYCFVSRHDITRCEPNTTDCTFVVT
jgi:hypothetical protein